MSSEQPIPEFVPKTNREKRAGRVREIDKILSSLKPIEPHPTPNLSSQWPEIGLQPTRYEPYPVDGTELDRFLWSLGKLESGHRYYIRNPYSGAYGKYQFIPSTWQFWANRYAQANGKDASTQTPENQEAVARFKAQTLFGQYGNWTDVASIWFSGRPYYSFRRPWQISDGYISLPGYTGDVVRGMNQKQKK